MGTEKKYTCEEALAWLDEKNKSYPERKEKNFATGKIEDSEEKDWREHGHKPIVAILSCADARVIPEKIFGAKRNELFVVRIAGNIATAETIASLEYAIGVLNVPLIVVLGHERCGAVEEAAKYIMNIGGELGNDLHRLLSYPVMAISPSALKDAEAWRKAAKKVKDGKLKPEFLKPLINENTKYAKGTLCNTGLKGTPICTAYYCFDTGVQWLEKCTCDTSSCNCN